MSQSLVQVLEEAYIRCFVLAYDAHAFSSVMAAKLKDNHKPETISPFTNGRYALKRLKILN